MTDTNIPLVDDEPTIKFRKLCANIMTVASQEVQSRGGNQTAESRAGNLFESVVQHYLSIEPQDSNADREVRVLPFTEWAQSEPRWAPRPTTDQGIDFVIAVEGDKKVTPVQVKFAEDATKSTSRKKIDAIAAQTISQGARQFFNDPILVTNAQEASKNLRDFVNRLLKDDGIRVQVYLESWFADINKALDEEGKTVPASLKDIQQASKSTIRTKGNTFKSIRDYQDEAIRHAVELFRSADATTFHMACGTGKTVAAWGTYQQMVQPGQVGVIFVPALSLVSSVIKTFRAQETKDNRYDIFAVCSDMTVNPNDDKNTLQAQEFDIDITDVGGKQDQVKSDPESIHHWLSQDSDQRRLLVATYQSASVVVEAVKDMRDKGEKFPVLVADEAHRLVSQGNFGEDMWSVPVAKRLFMTATPAVTVDAKGKRNSGEVEARAMDDAARFGQQENWFRYTTAEAVSEGYLSDYSIEILACNSDEKDAVHVANTYDEYRFSVFAHAGMKVMSEEREGKGLTVTFMSSIKKSKDFIEFMRYKHPKVPVAHVDGKMTVRHRTRLIQQMVKTGGIISNVRVLNEGIDIPELNAIMFCDPKGSKVDTIQAFGRPLRLDPNNPDKTARIILPIILSNKDLDDDGDFDMELSSTAYRPLWHVMRALHDNGDSIIDCFYVLNDPTLAGKIRNGRRMPTLSEANDGVERIRIDTMMAQFKEKTVEDPEYFNKVLMNSVALKTIVSTEGSWWLNYDKFVTFYAEHERQPSYSRSVEEKQLAEWVGKQRAAGRAYRGGKTHTSGGSRALTQEQYEKLDNTEGWDWGATTDRYYQFSFDERVEQFSAFWAEHKRQPSQSATDEEKQLASWVNKKRAAGKAYCEGKTHTSSGKRALTQEQYERLDNTEGWDWTANDTFDERVEQFSAFWAEYRRQPSRRYATGEEKQLDSWVKVQRAAGRAYREGKTHTSSGKRALTQEQYEKLDNTEGWDWGKSLS